MSNTQPSESAIREALASVNDPELGRSLDDLQMLPTVEVADGQIRITVDLPTPAYPQPERITDAIRQALTDRSLDTSGLQVDFMSNVRGKNSGGKIGLQVKNIIAVGSGKGGVGKSTIAASLAYGLQHYGAKVGLMDADVYGPSIPHLVGAHGQPEIKQVPLEDGRVMERIDPIVVDNLKVISMGFLVPEDQAVIWRGPMLHKALTQFLQQVDWGDLDYLIVDMPPGTGDVAITLSQMVGLAGAVVVCTPQQVALLDAVKAVSMYRTVKIPILGMVENMSGEIFGRGGTKQKSADMNVPFLGEVPSEADIRIKGDAGRIADLFAEGGASRDALLNVCQRTAIEIAREVADSPEMPSLEIL
ncbi:Flagellum site-determining protein YlxH [Maioricimonas rarisocia]|uniref:Iron-sulfur cluster carrier protein n=1 Tax=Maioricimonas rarisocia TaxID=2528026 RepID=A0A517Z7Q6_9PLAN|nr:Mrp/NBP35 family ATP-binding protein [Maioricimonas rarisocia]QDU38506.1 Flagellum site-determining protein YlxH [Maioricimonas rarisocia]